MEDSSQSNDSGNLGKSKIQRYPLRSGMKPREKPVDPSEFSNSAASKRVRAASSVSKSVSVLDLSGKERTATKPPRRLSIPAKTTPSSVPKPGSSITPISEVRVKRTASTQKKLDTPVSDVSKSGTRKRFNVLSSSSYWISQIKLSEAAAKHSISLGFFKLALDAGCEPLQKMKDELSSYARRNNLDDLRDSVKDLFENYNILSETPQEKLQVSETVFQVALEEESRSSDDEVQSSVDNVNIEKPKPKPKAVPAKATQVSGSAKKNADSNRTRASVTKNSANSRNVSNNKPLKKPQKPNKQEITREKNSKKSEKKPAGEEGSVSPSADSALQENKENMDAISMGNLSEVM